MRTHINIGAYTITHADSRVTLSAHGRPQLFHDAATDAEARRVRAEYLDLVRGALNGSSPRLVETVKHG